MYTAVVGCQCREEKLVTESCASSCNIYLLELGLGVWMTYRMTNAVGGAGQACTIHS
jgi:hypothetical protein